MVGGCMVYGGWITTAVIIRPSQPSLAGVGAGAELGKKNNGENSGPLTGIDCNADCSCQNRLGGQRRREGAGFSVSEMGENNKFKI